MPNRDQTGPEGLGPLTGRRLGLCGRGSRLRRGYGRGLRYRRFWGRPVTYPDYSITEPVELPKEEQKKIVESEISDIEQELKTLKEELKKLE